MRNTYYFLQPSTTFSGLTTIARRIVDAAKATYGNCVMDRLAIDIMVEDLIVSARKAKQAFPRGKMPKIELTENTLADCLYIHIDDWSFIAYKVKDIIPIPTI